jgi:hypothetical protein
MNARVVSLALVSSWLSAGSLMVASNAMLSAARDATKRTWCIFGGLPSAYAAWRSGTTWAPSSPDKEMAQSRMMTVLAVSTAFELLSEA